jgi:hypothetical protein
MATTAVIGTAMSIRSQQQEASYRKGMGRYNERVAQNEAQETRRVAVEEENLQRRRTAELVSKQRAQLGAANVELTSGSPLQLTEDTMTLGEADALRIRSNYESRIGSLETSGELSRSQGDAFASISRGRQAGTLLTGIGSVVGSGVADKWFTENSAGSNP